jgi:hypothetical protein
MSDQTQTDRLDMLDFEQRKAAMLLLAASESQRETAILLLEGSFDLVHGANR